MRYFLTFALLAALFASVPTDAYGAITLGSLRQGINELEDDDFDMLVNAGGSVFNPGVFVNNDPGQGVVDPILGVGDFIAGVIRIGAIRVPKGGPQVATATDTEATFTAIVLQKVRTISASAGGIGGAPDGNNDVFVTFEAPTVAEWNAVFDTAGAGAGINVATSPGTIAVVFEDPDNFDQSNGVGAFSEIDGTELYEIGITGGAGLFESFTGQQDTDNVLNAFSISTGSYGFFLNITEQGAGPDLFFHSDGGSPFAQFIGRNGSIGSTTGIPDLVVSTDIDILISPNIVPEPASFAVWGLFVALVGGFCINRRRQK